MMATTPRIRWTGVLAILLLTFTVLHCAEVAPASDARVPLPQHSAGVFIGVEKFSYDYSLLDVRFAVNDAVDLAHSLVIEHGMLPANRVLLLLAGEPVGDSRDRLRRLLDLGAKRQSARQADIYSLVKEQSKLVTRGGVLVLSISTHGFSDGGEHFLITEDSLLEFRTGVTAENLLQATQAGPGGGLKLLLIDACREQLVKPSWKGSSPGEPDRRSVMPTELTDTLAANQGYAVFSAASGGQFAYSGDRNGFFTGAILTSLHCQDGEEVKTLRGLTSLVSKEVAKQSWGRQQPELRTGGGADDFILFRCDSKKLAPVPEPTLQPVTPELLDKIRAAANLLAVGGPDNVERSFRLYWEAFQELPAATLATLNQGLVARAQQLDESSRADEGIRIYRQLLDPLLAQSSANPRSRRTDQ